MSENKIQSIVKIQKKPIKKSIGIFDYKFRFNTNQSIYLVFNREDYNSINHILERESALHGLCQSYTHMVNKENYKVREIIKLHTEDRYRDLYHIEDCTVQIFTNFPANENIAGILIINQNKEKREKALSKLEEVFTSSKLEKALTALKIQEEDRKRFLNNQ